MGSASLINQSNRTLICPTSPKIEFAVPDSKKANIGENMFPHPYSEEKTLQLWTNLLRNFKSNHPIDQLLTDTKYCKVLTRYIKHGVPMKFRWQTWKSYINVSLLSEEKYKSIPLDRNLMGDVIKKDVDRTFPDHKYFDKQEYGYIGQFALLRILCKFSTLYFNVGYCQGMNFIAGFLLIVSGGREIESFCMLEAIIYHFKIDDFYTEHMVGLKNSLIEFNELFQRDLKNLYWHFRDNDISDDMWVLKWFITLFTAVLPFRVVVSIWDLLVVDGICILGQVALSILKYFEKQLLSKDIYGILEVLNSLRNLEIDPEKILCKVVTRKGRSKTDGKIFPFTHPPSQEPEVFLQKTESTYLNSPGVIVKHCHIIEDPLDLPITKSQSTFPKQHSKHIYKNIFNEDYKAELTLEESFDAGLILKDLIAEDKE